MSDVATLAEAGSVRAGAVVHRVRAVGVQSARVVEDPAQYACVRPRRAVVARYACAEAVDACAVRYGGSTLYAVSTAVADTQQLARGGVDAPIADIAPTGGVATGREFDR